MYENPSVKGLNPMVYLRGFDLEAYRRLVFRLTHLEKMFLKREEILMNGNIASVEVEIANMSGLCRDLIDTTREFATLVAESFREEQGLATPPNQ